MSKYFSFLRKKRSPSLPDEDATDFHSLSPGKIKRNLGKKKAKKHGDANRLSVQSIDSYYHDDEGEDYNKQSSEVDSIHSDNDSLLDNLSYGEICVDSSKLEWEKAEVLVVTEEVPRPSSSGGIFLSDDEDKDDVRKDVTSGGEVSSKENDNDDLCDNLIDDFMEEAFNDLEDIDDADTNVSPILPNQEVFGETPLTKIRKLSTDVEEKYKIKKEEDDESKELNESVETISGNDVNNTYGDPSDDFQKSVLDVLNKGLAISGEAYLNDDSNVSESVLNTFEGDSSVPASPVSITTQSNAMDDSVSIVNIGSDIDETLPIDGSEEECSVINKVVSGNKHKIVIDIKGDFTNVSVERDKITSQDSIIKAVSGNQTDEANIAHTQFNSAFVTNLIEVTGEYVRNNSCSDEVPPEVIDKCSKSNYEVISCAETYDTNDTAELDCCDKITQVTAESVDTCSSNDKNLEVEHNAYPRFNDCEGGSSSMLGEGTDRNAVKLESDDLSGAFAMSSLHKEISVESTESTSGSEIQTNHLAAEMEASAVIKVGETPSQSAKGAYEDVNKNILIGQIVVKNYEKIDFEESIVENLELERNIEQKSENIIKEKVDSVVTFGENTKKVDDVENKEEKSICEGNFEKVFEESINERVDHQNKIEKKTENKESVDETINSTENLEFFYEENIKENIIDKKATEENVFSEEYVVERADSEDYIEEMEKVELKDEGSSRSMSLATTTSEVDEEYDSAKEDLSWDDDGKSKEDKFVDKMLDFHTDDPKDNIALAVVASNLDKSSEDNSQLNDELFSDAQSHHFKKKEEKDYVHHNKKNGELSSSTCIESKTINDAVEDKPRENLHNLNSVGHSETVEIVKTDNVSFLKEPQTGVEKCEGVAQEISESPINLEKVITADSKDNEDCLFTDNDNKSAFASNLINDVTSFINSENKVNEEQQMNQNVNENIKTEEISSTNNDSSAVGESSNTNSVSSAVDESSNTKSESSVIDETSNTKGESSRVDENIITKSESSAVDESSNTKIESSAEYESSNTKSESSAVGKSSFIKDGSSAVEVSSFSIDDSSCSQEHSSSQDSQKLRGDGNMNNHHSKQDLNVNAGATINIKDGKINSSVDDVSKPKKNTTSSSKNKLKKAERNKVENECESKRTHSESEDNFFIKVVNSDHDEAEARLAQRRAARAEARELRLRELEKQQQEQDNEEEQQYAANSYAPADKRIQKSTLRPNAPNAPKSSTRAAAGGRSSVGRSSMTNSTGSGGQFSRRSSEDSTPDDALSSTAREIKAELKEVEEKFRKAMITNAQLDNEKATLMFEVEFLKDKYSELEENHIQLTKDHRKKCSENEQLRKLSNKLKEEVKMVRKVLQERDSLIQEYGLVLIGEENGEENNDDEYDEEMEDDTINDLSPRKIAVKKALLSQEASELLSKGAAKGSLDVRLKKYAEDKHELEDEVRRLKLELEEELHRRRKENGLDYEKQKEASKSLNEYKFRIQKAEAEVSTLQANVARLESLVTRYKTTSEELESSEEELKAEKRKLQRELREAQNRLEELELTTSHLQKRFDKLKTARSTLLKDLSQDPV